MQSITFLKPDDMHIHLRDEDFLKTTVNDVAKAFQRCIVMPNLSDPVSTTDAARQYSVRIMAALNQPSSAFTPLMTLYLTDKTSPTIITEAKNSGVVFGCKLYPQGATTNADKGVTDLSLLDETFAKMEELGLPLLVHGEVTSTQVDVFDREKRFIDDILIPLTAKFPKMRIVLEHITTQDAVQFVTDASNDIAATITPHHLRYNRNILFTGGIRPHYYCLPILKRRIHQEALQHAAISGNPKFFLGTDSAPHTLAKKESSCGCAGIYSGHAAVEIYLQIFESLHALDKFEAFAAHFGADFYQIPRNTEKVTYLKKPWQVPLSYPFGTESLVPMCAGETLQWQLAN